MRFENPFDEEDFRRADAIEATREMHADAWFVGVQAYIQFVEEFLKPQIRGLLGVRTPREEAVLDVYHGILGFLLSVNALRDPWHVQAIASCARSIFELYVDLLLLHGDPSALNVERFHSFADVERLRVAKARLAFFDAHPGLPYADPRYGLAAQRAFVRDEEARIEVEIARLWPAQSRGRPQAPRHWSGVRELRARAESISVECEALYWQYYAHLSWFVHTASVGTRGLAKESLHMVIANALELVRRNTIETFRVLGTEVHLDVAIDGLADKLGFLERVFFLRLVALKLGEADRFSFLD
jgi:hypothetical protein